MKTELDKPLYSLTVSEFINLNQDLLDGFAKRIQQKQSEPDEWVNTIEAKRMLGVKSKSKLQQLRDSGGIKFSKHKRIIMYSRKSILEFLEKNVPKF